MNLLACVRATGVWSRAWERLNGLLNKTHSATVPARRTAHPDSWVVPKCWNCEGGLRRVNSSLFLGFILPRIICATTARFRLAHRSNHLALTDAPKSSAASVWGLSIRLRTPSYTAYRFSIRTPVWTRSPSIMDASSVDRGNYVPSYYLLLSSSGPRTKAAGEAASIRTWPLQEFALCLCTCIRTTCCSFAARSPCGLS